MLLLSVLLAWLGSRRMYTPIERLLTQIGLRRPGLRAGRTDEFQLIGEQVHSLFQSKSQLEKEVSQHLGQVRTFFLIQAFGGNLRRRELIEELEQYGYGKQVKEWKTMAVITLSIDFSEENSYEKKRTSICCYSQLII
ncbi:hypothetical protein ACFSQ7_08995 [Paenibacillus rhizoplanae]